MVGDHAARYELSRTTAASSEPENIDEWLAGGDLARMQAILDDRERPYYEHRKAA